MRSVSTLDRDGLSAVLGRFVLNHVAGSRAVTTRARLAMLRRCGIRVGSAVVHPGVRFFTTNVDLADGVEVRRGTVFVGIARIQVGRGVVLDRAVLDTAVPLGDGLDLHVPIVVPDFAELPARGRLGDGAPATTSDD